MATRYAKAVELLAKWCDEGTLSDSGRCCSALVNGQVVSFYRSQDLGNDIAECFKVENPDNPSDARFDHFTGYYAGSIHGSLRFALAKHRWAGLGLVSIHGSVRHETSGLKPTGYLTLGDAKYKSRSPVFLKLMEDFLAGQDPRPLLDWVQDQADCPALMNQEIQRALESLVARVS